MNYTYNTIQQTLYFKIEPFTVNYLYALLLYALLFTHDISFLGLTIQQHVFFCLNRDLL